MELIKIVHEDCCLAQASFPDKEAVLRAVAEAAARVPVLSETSPDEIFRRLRDREEIGSTGFGAGIAIPHCRMPDICEFVLGVVAIPDGVDFAALDGEPLRVAAFIIAPEDEAREQIRLLSCISRALGQPAHVRELAAAATPEALRESFLRHAVMHLEVKKGEGKNLFHVFLQNEDLFRQVLQIFSAIPQCDTLILDAQSESAYLSKLPMFAGFWTDKPSAFAQVVIAMVNKSVTNETLRQIEGVVGPLEHAEGILVAVEELFFSAGSLKY